MDHNTYNYQDENKPPADSFEMYDLPMQTVDLDILGGTTLSYHHTPQPPNPLQPTLLLLPSFATTVEIFHYQLTNPHLAKSTNMLAINPLGHGKTRTQASEWTNQDSAKTCLAALDALDISGRISIAGLGHGAYLAVQIALLAPERVAGLIPISASLSTTERSSQLQRAGDLSNSRNSSSTSNSPTPTTTSLPAYIHDNWTQPSIYRIFQPSSDFLDALISTGFGCDVGLRDRDFWSVSVRENWSGEGGRKHARMAAINVREREALGSRLGEVKCPVLWLHGEEDEVVSVRDAREEIGMFGGAEKRVEVLGGGTHYLTWSRGDDGEDTLNCGNIMAWLSWSPVII
ncbi:Nn.00g112130.m01.CDS01 [Neocucurbitaria sp. VM-36]